MEMDLLQTSYLMFQCTFGVKKKKQTKNQESLNFWKSMDGDDQSIHLEQAVQA